MEIHVQHMPGVLSNRKFDTNKKGPAYGGALYPFSAK
jgi:hypothetical protein